MNGERTLARDVRTAVKTLRILRNDVRVRLELARVASSNEWRKLEMHLHDVEQAAAEPGSRATRAAVVDAVHQLEKFSSLLPLGLIVGSVGRGRVAMGDIR